MRSLIVYDSVYGNTEKIAKSIGGSMGGDVRVLRAGEVSASDLDSIDLLVVGSPTYGGRPTPPIKNFLGGVSEGSIKGRKVASFDTRLSSRLAVVFGYAAGKIGDSLKKRGGDLILSPEGFKVRATKGPLIEGEIERAANWARKLETASI